MDIPHLQRHTELQAASHETNNDLGGFLERYNNILPPISRFHSTHPLSTIAGPRILTPSCAVLAAQYPRSFTKILTTVISIF